MLKTTSNIKGKLGFVLTHTCMPCNNTESSAPFVHWISQAMACHVYLFLLWTISSFPIFSAHTILFFQSISLVCFLLSLFVRFRFIFYDCLKIAFSLDCIFTILLDIERWKIPRGIQILLVSCLPYYLKNVFESIWSGNVVNIDRQRISCWQPIFDEYLYEEKRLLIVKKKKTTLKANLIFAIQIKYRIYNKYAFLAMAKIFVIIEEFYSSNILI